MRRKRFYQFHSYAARHYLQVKEWISSCQKSSERMVDIFEEQSKMYLKLHEGIKEAKNIEDPHLPIEAKELLNILLELLAEIFESFSNYWKSKQEFLKAHDWNQKKKEFDNINTKDTFNSSVKSIQFPMVNHGSNAISLLGKSFFFPNKHE